MSSDINIEDTGLAKSTPCYLLKQHFFLTFVLLTTQKKRKKKKTTDKDLGSASDLLQVIARQEKVPGISNREPVVKIHHTVPNEEKEIQPEARILQTRQTQFACVPWPPHNRKGLQRYCHCNAIPC